MNNYKEKVYPVNSNLFGLTYEEWTCKWWQWFLSIPGEKNPALDSNGKNCDINQNDSNVWFLAGTAHPGYANRICTIPSTKAIFFPIIATQISYAEAPFLRTDADLVSYAAKDIVRWQHLEVLIDDTKLYNPERYRVQSGAFELMIPENNCCGLLPGRTKAATDGFWICLRPLSSGNHELYFSGSEPNFHTEVKYQLLVK